MADAANPIQNAGAAGTHDSRAETLIAVMAAMLLAGIDLLWNFCQLNIGLADFFGVAVFSHGLTQNGAWPATPYFPIGYPLLLMPWGMLGERLGGTWGTLPSGYIYSACGMALAYWALYRLARTFGLPPAAGLLAMVLGWAAPIVRVAAGSPSVDALYSGLGLWFLAAALAIWRDPPATMAGARWLCAGIVASAIALPLIRYHSVILLAPVLLVLLIWRPRWRRLAVAGLACMIAVLAFNQASYYIAYSRPLASVVGIQIRSGLEQDLHLHYPTPEHYLAQYPDFCRHARTTPLTADYTRRQLIVHTLHGWYGFMRRPSVALSIALLGLTLLLRRRLPIGAMLAVAWIAGYTLSLSPAYFTQRAAALPVLLGVALSLALAAQLLRRGLALAGAMVAGALLLAGYAMANRYSRAEFAERRYYAGASRDVERYIAEDALPRDKVVTSDWRVMPLTANPWCLPYAHTELSWIDDPEIDSRQRPGLTPVSANALAAGQTTMELVILRPGHPREEELMVIPQSRYWRLDRDVDGLQLYRPSGVPVLATVAQASRLVHIDGGRGVPPHHGKRGSLPHQTFP